MKVFRSRIPKGCIIIVAFLWSETFSFYLSRSLQHSKVVPWMRKTEYISTEFNRFGVGAERQEAKIGYGIRKKFGNEPTYKDRESQIVAINKTFEDVSAAFYVLQSFLNFLQINTHPKKHYSKPGVYAVEELPVLPDFDVSIFYFFVDLHFLDGLRCSTKLCLKILMFY